MQISQAKKKYKERENTLCPQCLGAGYKGRIVFMNFYLTENPNCDITETDREVEQIAVNENSMLTLTQYGVELVKEHLTTTSELIRVCKTDF